jgi:hypothetical protein
MNEIFTIEVIRQLYDLTDKAILTNPFDDAKRKELIERISKQTGWPVKPRSVLKPLPGIKPKQR